MSTLGVTKVQEKLDLFVVTGYGIGNFGYGFVTQLITAYLVFFGTVILRLPGSLIGIIISSSIVWDAISDPLMGYISDITQSKYGKRHLYIVIGTVGISICNYALWSVGTEINFLWKFLWLLIAVILLKTSVTVFLAPYSALGAEMTNDYNKRSLIQGVKTMFYLLAFLVVGAGGMFIFFRPTSQYAVGQLNPLAYRNIAMAGSVIMLISGYITYQTTKHFIPIIEAKTTTQNGFKIKELVDAMKFCLSLKSYLYIFWGYLFTNLASAIISAVGLHTFTYTFMLGSREIGLVLGTQFVVSLLSQPIWIKISFQYSKNKAVKTGLFISIVGCLMLCTMTLFRSYVIVQYEYLLIYAAVVGFGTSGLFSLPLSMIADTVDEQEFHTGKRNEGAYYGLLNFGYKFSQACAIMLLGVLLDVIRFDATLGQQTSSTSILLGLILSLGSLLCFVFASIAYRRYNMDEEQILQIQESIQAQKKYKFMEDD